MECQREDAPGAPVHGGTSRRLTDQALVAVTLARASAAARAAASPATVVDLVVGLAAEPEGAAGHLLRERPSAATALHAAGAVPAARLDAALDAAASAGPGADDDAPGPAVPRPLATLDLLAGAITAGGQGLADVLDAAGLDAADMADLLPDEGGAAAWDVTWLAHAETYGFDPRGDPELTRPVARVIAQVRAVGGGAIDVLLAVSASPDAAVGVLPSHERLRDASWRLRKRGRPAGVAPDAWDVGLDEVVRAARAWRTSDRVTALDLVRAAALAGGVGPRTLLEEADRP